MNTLRHLVRSINFNYVLYAVALAAALYIVTSQYVTDAIVNFCFGGIVPGTTIVLSPEDMVLGVIVILGTMIALVLVLWLTRIVSTRRALGRMFYEAGTPKTRTSKQAAVVIVKEQVRSQHAPVGRRRISTQAVDYELVDRVAITLSSLGSSLKQDVRYVADMIGGIYWLLLGIIWFVLRTAVRIIMIVVMTLSLIVAAALSLGKRCLLFLEPHVHRLDSWLEVQCKTTLALTKKKLKHSQSMQVFGLMVHDSKANLRNIFK